MMVTWRAPKISRSVRAGAAIPVIVVFLIVGAQLAPLVRFLSSQHGLRGEQELVEAAGDLSQTNRRGGLGSAPDSVRLGIVQYFGDHHSHSICPDHVLQSLNHISTLLAHKWPSELGHAQVVLISDALCQQAMRATRNPHVLLVDAAALRSAAFGSGRNDTSIRATMMRFVPSRKSTAYEQRQSAVCNQRWTLLLQHMSEAGLPYALVTDSDTLLFVKPSELLQELSPQCDVALVLHEPPQLPVNPGSVFLSVRGLRDFVRFASELLAQLEPSPHDMRLWAWYAYINQAAQLDRAFAKELDTKAIEALIEAGHVARPQYKVCSLARLMNHSATFDDNLKFSRGFIQMPYTDEKSQRSFKFKVVQWNRTDGMPYFMRERQSLGNAKHRFAGPKYVRALALHFQGTKKTFMDGYTVSDHTLCGRRPDQANQSAPATDAQWCRCMSPACETCLPHFCDLISPSLVPPSMTNIVPSNL